MEFYTKVQCTVTATELPTDDNDNGGGGDICLLAPLSALVGRWFTGSVMLCSCVAQKLKVEPVYLRLNF